MNGSRFSRSSRQVIRTVPVGVDPVANRDYTAWIDGNRTCESQATFRSAMPMVRCGWRWVVLVMVSSDRLPGFLRTRLQGRETLRRAINNSSWLMAEQLLRLVAGLFVGVWVARHLGPQGYGWLSYAVATVGMVTALTAPAVNALVVRGVAQEPANASAWLGAAFFLRGVGGALGFLLCIGVAAWHGGDATPVAALIMVAAVGLLFQVFDVADLLLQGRGEARVGAGVRIVAIVAGAVSRVSLIVVDAPLIAFAVAGVLELGVAAIGWWWTTRRVGGVGRWRGGGARAWALLRESWPLTTGGLAITVQAYADQLVIGMTLGADELGQYAAAMRLVTAFVFLPMVVQTVVAPEIARAKRDDETLYRRRLHSLYRVMAGLFFVTGLPLVIAGPFATRWLYGTSYAPAAGLLPWLGWRLLLTNLGVARSVFLTSEGLLNFGLMTSVVGAVINVALNLLLVPRYGALGAVAAALTSFAVTTFALEGLNTRARENRRQMALAVLLPWRRFEA